MKENEGRREEVYLPIDTNNTYNNYTPHHLSNAYLINSALHSPLLFLSSSSPDTLQFLPKSPHGGRHRDIHSRGNQQRPTHLDPRPQREVVHGRPPSVPRIQRLPPPPPPPHATPPWKSESTYSRRHPSP